MTEHTTYTEEALFLRLTKLFTEMELLKGDVKQLKTDFSYDEDLNSKGLNKDIVKLVEKAAKLFVAQSFEQKSQEAKEVFAKYVELTDYNA